MSVQNEYFLAAKAYQDTKTAFDRTAVGQAYKEAKKDLKLGYWCYVKQADHFFEGATLVKATKKFREWQLKGCPYFSIEDVTINDASMRRICNQFTEAYEAVLSIPERTRARESKKAFKTQTFKYLKNNEETPAELKDQISTLDAKTRNKIDGWYAKFTKQNSWGCVIL